MKERFWFWPLADSISGSGLPVAARLPHAELKLKDRFWFWPLADDSISSFGLPADSSLVVLLALLPQKELKLKDRLWFWPLADSISGFELLVAALLPQEVLKLNERFFETPKVATAKMAKVKKIERNNFIIRLSKATTPVYCLNFTANYLISNSAFIGYFIG